MPPTESERLRVAAMIRRRREIDQRLFKGDVRAIDDSLSFAEDYRDSHPWLWDMVIDTTIEVMTSLQMQLERAEKLARERVAWCRDKRHILTLARVCRARGGRLVNEATALELEAASTEDQHPQYADEPQ